MPEISRHERRFACSWNSVTTSSTTSTRKVSLGEHLSTNYTAEDTTTKSVATCPTISIWRTTTLCIPSNR
jgi:hypothetical protein